MGKSTNWFHLAAELMYLCIQTLVLFYFLFFFSSLFDTLYFSEGVLPLIIVIAWVSYLPMTFLRGSAKMLWFIISFLGSVYFGITYVDFSILIIIFFIVLFFFILNRSSADQQMSKEHFNSLFVISLLYFGLLIFITFFARYTDEEVWRFIRFLLLLLLTTLMGMGITQLNRYNVHGSKEGFWKNWGIQNGLRFGNVAILSIASIVLIFILQFIFNLIKPAIEFLFGKIIYWAITLLSTIIDTFTGLIKVKNRQSPMKTMLDSLQEVLKELNKGDRDYLVLDIILISIFTIVVISIIIWIIYIIFKKTQQVNNSYESNSNDDSIISEAISSNKKGSPSIWQRGKEFFTPYSAMEEHPIRKEYRQMLKLLRKKGIWKNNSMTVQQINHILADLEGSSRLYEKLRYGNLELNDAEINMFKQELTQVMKRMEGL